MPEKASRSIAVMRRRWKFAPAALVVGAVAALALLGAAGSPSKAAARKGGIVRSASSAIRSGARSSSTQASSTKPIAGTGHFDGSSPLVSSLPVLPVSPATQIRSRDNENLHPQAQPTSDEGPGRPGEEGTGTGSRRRSPTSTAIACRSGTRRAPQRELVLRLPAARHERRGRRRRSTSRW